MAQEIHVAVIGAGYWGYKLIKEYLALSREEQRVKLSAIVDISEERLQRISKEFNLPTNILYKDPEVIAKRDDINAVHIATPNETHYKIALLMLEHDKHILLEKPMALTSREAFKLARIAEEKNKVLLVGHIFRFNNALRKMKEILNNSDEKVYYMELIWSTYMHPPHNRDIIFDLAPHPIDIINYLTDEWPVEVYTVGKSFIRQQQGLEEVSYSLLRMPNDIIISIKLSWIEYGPKTRHVKIITNRSTYQIDALIQTITKYDKNGKKEINITPSNTMREMIRHFIDLISNGGAPNNSALIGALTVTVLEAMRESLIKKRTVTILSR